MLAARGLDGDVRVLPARRERAPRRHPPREPRTRARASTPRCSQRRRGDRARSSSTTSTTSACSRSSCSTAGERRALLANEIAPRVHNSGHWTIEGAETSQFEQHLRAVLGWPLGSPDAARARGDGATRSASCPPRDAVLAVPGAHLHDYGKAAAARSQGRPRHGRRRRSRRARDAPGRAARDRAGRSADPSTRASRRARYAW